MSEERRAELTEKMKGNTYTLGFKMPESAKEKMRENWKDPEFKARVIAARHASGQYSPEAVVRRAEVRKANRLARIAENV